MIEQAESDMASSLVSDLGGQLGLWMGISMVSLMEVMVCFCRVCRRCKKRNSGRTTNLVEII